MHGETVKLIENSLHMNLNKTLGFLVYTTPVMLIWKPHIISMLIHQCPILIIKEPFFW